MAAGAAATSGCGAGKSASVFRGGVLLPVTAGAFSAAAFVSGKGGNALLVAGVAVTFAGSALGLAATGALGTSGRAGSPGSAGKASGLV